MHVNITGHHIEITPALRQRVDSKFERIERHIDSVTDIHVILSVEKKRHKAEATISATRAKLHAESVEEDMYAAIDSLIDKLDRQVKKHKEKLNNHYPRNARKPRLG